MDVMMMVPADYAESNPGGKFTLVGAGFDKLMAKKVPFVKSLMFLLVRLKVTKRDKGGNKIILRLVGERGALVRAEFNVECKIENEDKFIQGFINIPWRLVNIKFEAFGEYEFEVEVNGEIALKQTLQVICATPQKLQA